MLVADVMSTDVVSVPRSATLRAVVSQMLDEDVGSVVVTSDAGHPAGMVTESDALRAAYATGDPLNEIAVGELSHRPVVTTEPAATLEGVARTMADEEVKKVPVLDDLDLVGIVTLTDIVWHLSDIRRQAEGYGEAFSRWDPD